MDWQRGKIRASLRITPVTGPNEPTALLEQLALQASPVLLDSSASHDALGRFSIAACNPQAVLEVRDGKLYDQGNNCLAEDNETLWSLLGRAFECIELRNAPGPQAGPGYLPGWIGYVGYEIARTIETLPCQARRDTPLGDLRLGFYDAIALFDTIEQSWLVVELIFDQPGPPSLAGAILRQMLLRAKTARPEQPPPPETMPGEANLPRSNFSPDEYRQAITKCINYIAAGDIFQVNLSQRFEVEPCPQPLNVYRQLRQVNPAWYSAWLAFEAGGEQCSLLCSSPELFLRCREGLVVTRPIKGTRPRSDNPRDDQAGGEELLASEKDNAELAMIIDLLRNDLGRVCKFGTVRVTNPVSLETHPTVFHLVGTVEGKLLEGLGQADLLRATFPGGSITGAPKIRAMEIIDEIEPVARGVYTGCVGIVGADGRAEWNIVIRTVICIGRRALVQVGGGIVADSTAQGEYLETLDKARAMLQAIALACKDADAS
jgi:para-aminobenzoate synthetase component 1